MTQGGHMSMDDRADQKIMSGPLELDFQVVILLPWY